MGTFSKPLTVTKVGERTWSIEDPFIYTPDHYRPIAVPRGFVTDFASIPQVLWNILPPDDDYTQAAVVHDYIYGNGRHEGRSRLECDNILLSGMKDLKVPFYRRWPIYLAVRSFGWMFFDKP